MTKTKKVPAWNKGLKKGRMSLLLRKRDDGTQDWYCSECQRKILVLAPGNHSNYPMEHMDHHVRQKYAKTHVFFGSTMVPREAFVKGCLYNP